MRRRLFVTLLILARTRARLMPGKGWRFSVYPCRRARAQRSR